jgi:Domain of unknown function (DUF6265)
MLTLSSRRSTLRHVCARALLAAGCIAAVALVAGAGLDQTTSKTPAASATDHSTTFSQLAFLQGAWKGSMGDSAVEEIWSGASGRNIMGCFRWMNGDEPGLLELLSISHESDAIRLRLLHATSTLAPKETKPMTLKLASSDATFALFEAEADCEQLASVRYELKDQALHITVSFSPPADATKPAPKPLHFVLKKA